MNFIVKSDPFAQGLPRDVVIKLLECKRAPDKATQAKYHRTPHFAMLKEAALALYQTCAICGRPDGEKAGMTVHHRGGSYAHLFCEHLTRDIILVCSRCHAHIHRK